MKKIVALMLALILILSASIAFAEQAEEALPAGLTLSSSISVERGAAGGIMEALGIAGDRQTVVDSALAVLNTVNDRLTIAKNGIDYRFAMNDTELMSVTGGMTDEGLVLMSSLIPDHALTLSADTLGKMAELRGLLEELKATLQQDQKSSPVEEALEALMPYIESFLDRAASAVRFGAPEKGVFDFGDGISYNTRQPIGVDTQAVDEALKDVLSKIVQDEKVVAALDKLDISVEDLQKLPAVNEHLPAVDMNLYSYTDDSGAEISSDRCFSFAVTLPGQDAASMSFDLHMWQKSIDAVLSIPGSGENSGVTATFTFAPFDLETAVGGISLAVDANGSYYAASGVITPNADNAALTLSNALYIKDPGKPLAEATTTIEATDAPLDLSIGDRKAVPVESLFGKAGKKMRKKLRNSLMFSGLSIIATATEEVPEVADLLSVLSGETEEAEEAYTEKEVPVYRDSLESAETIGIRMYGDIPYMKIDDFYNGLIFTGAEQYPGQASPMAVTRNGSVYEATAFDGTKAVFDAEADTFECENLDKYANPPYYALLLASERDPSAPFVRNSRVEYSGEVVPVKVDFRDYGIDIVGDGDDLWIPMGTLQCLFASPFGYNPFFNGKAVYIEDLMETLQPVSARTMDEDYYAFMDSPRSEERARFDYNNLCFYVDTCYGCPERCRLSASIAEVGLDRTLDQTIDGMDLPAIRESLLSTDMEEYVSGMFVLLTAMDDGGHTSFADQAMVNPDRVAAWMDKLAATGIAPMEATDYADVSKDAIVKAIQLVPKDSFDLIEDIDYDNGEWAKYYEKGDTALYLFQHFYCNRAAWTSYEDGQLGEMPEDTIGTFMKALDKARSNPNIKKFVVFLPLNGGGESGVAAAMSKILCGQAYRHQYDAYTGQDEIIYYDIDLNFDGVFDEKDEAVSYPFQFAVVEGASTYSAANYLTNMAKDNGVCVLGEMSSGGAFSPQRTPDSEGIVFHLSARYKMRDKNNESVDLGVTPDYLLTEEKNGETDYSRFFDFDEISRLMDDYYGNQQ